MARVTIEDCKKIVDDHFELVVLASKRGRDISSGSPILIEKTNDKNAVIALREIAGHKIKIESLREAVLQDFRKFNNDSDKLKEKTEDYFEHEDDNLIASLADFDDGLQDDFLGDETELETGVEQGDFFPEDMSFEDENSQDD